LGAASVEAASVRAVTTDNDTNTVNANSNIAPNRDLVTSHLRL